MLADARQGWIASSEGRKKKRERILSISRGMGRKEKSREEENDLSLSTNLVSRSSSTKSSILSSLLIIPDIWRIYRRLRCKYHGKKKTDNCMDIKIVSSYILLLRKEYFFLSMMASFNKCSKKERKKRGKNFSFRSMSSDYTKYISNTRGSIVEILLILLNVRGNGRKYRRRK